MAVTEQVRRSRLTGVDVARGVALLGMMAVHVFPARVDGVGGTTLVHHLASGRAAALFAVLAGVGLALLSGGRRPRVDGALVRAVAVRSLLLALVGLALGIPDSGLAVILVYYGVLFLVALPMLGLRAGALAALALAAAVVTPVLSFLLRPALPERLAENPTADLVLTDPAGLLSTLLVTGYYPVLCWTTYLCAGLAAGRLDLGDRAVQVRLAVGGALLAATASLLSALLLGPMGGLAAIAPDVRRDTDVRDTDVRDVVAGNQFGNVPADGSAWWLATDAPHSSTPFDLLHTTGTALLVLGLALLLAPRLGLAARPLAALGAMTLTLYAVHVLVVSIAGRDGSPAVLWGGQVLAYAAFALLWLSRHRRGPLEAVVHAVARR